MENLYTKNFFRLTRMPLDVLIMMNRAWNNHLLLSIKKIMRKYHFRILYTFLVVFGLFV
ncbi:unnamed protein product [Trichobilharzia regenti]|nr:unnamed protein product [Trichobilharzia regenti]